MDVLVVPGCGAGGVDGEVLGHHAWSLWGCAALRRN